MKSEIDITLQDMDYDIARYIQDHAHARFLFDHYVDGHMTLHELYVQLAIHMARELYAQ